MKDYIWVVEAKFEWGKDFIPFIVTNKYGGSLTRQDARKLARDERSTNRNSLDGLDSVRVRKYVRAGK